MSVELSPEPPRCSHCGAVLTPTGYRCASCGPSPAGAMSAGPHWDLRETLTNVCQLLDGWHADGTAWSEWDEQVRQNASRHLADAYAKAQQDAQPEWEMIDNVRVRWDDEAKVFVGLYKVYSQGTTKEEAVAAVKSAIITLGDLLSKKAEAQGERREPICPKCGDHVSGIVVREAPMTSQFDWDLVAQCDNCVYEVTGHTLEDFAQFFPTPKAEAALQGQAVDVEGIAREFSGQVIIYEAGVSLNTEQKRTWLIEWLRKHLHPEVQG